MLLKPLIATLLFTKASVMRSDLVAVGADHVTFGDLCPNLLSVVGSAPTDVEQLHRAGSVVEFQRNVVSPVAAVCATA